MNRIKRPTELILDKEMLRFDIEEAAKEKEVTKWCKLVVAYWSTKELGINYDGVAQEVIKRAQQ